jgi:hypothetical protein
MTQAAYYTLNTVADAAGAVTAAAAAAGGATAAQTDLFIILPQPILSTNVLQPLFIKQVPQ